jgi:DNA-binding XRE family transcriptional regulator
LESGSKPKGSDAGSRCAIFAAQVGVHVSTITAVENRGTMPKFLIVVEMAQVLECSIDYLAGLED